MKYYVIAGEKSGDLHGANLITALRNEDNEAIIRAWGGDSMEKAGSELLVHYRNLALMGFKEVITGMGKILRYLSLAKKDILEFQPDVIILIDFAGFNLKVAQFAKKKGIKVFYYISPKVWAWNQSRAKKIKRLVDKMFVILPFEKDFYKRFDYDVDYVGNPLVDSCYAHQVNPAFRENNNIDERPVIAILPGSRKQEVENLLSCMLSLIPSYPQYNFIIAGVDNLPEQVYENAKSHQNVKVLFNQTYDLLANAYAAMVTSGTATLETALFEVPQVVCYKTSSLTYYIAQAVIKVKFISLVNLIANKKVVEELIQDNLKSKTLCTEFEKITKDKNVRDRQINSYRRVKDILGKEKASPKLAKLILKYLKEKA